jgi:hypothetical protein
MFVDPLSLPIEKDMSIKELCIICHSPGVEIHHWAPQYLWELFGFNDADKWPTAYLCRPCHQKWHDIVTPGMTGKNHD